MVIRTARDPAVTNRVLRTTHRMGNGACGRRGWLQQKGSGTGFYVSADFVAARKQPSFGTVLALSDPRRCELLTRGALISNNLSLNPWSNETLVALQGKVEVAPKRVKA